MHVEPLSFLPLTPLFFHILLALVDGEAHGYEIMKEVEERSGHRVKVGPGTLYEGIQRLAERGLLVERAQPGPGKRINQRRRYYGLTPLGRAVLRAEAKRLADVVVVRPSQAGPAASGPGMSRWPPRPGRGSRVADATFRLLMRVALPPLFRARYQAPTLHAFRDQLVTTRSHWPRLPLWIHTVFDLGEAGLRVRWGWGS